VEFSDFLLRDDDDHPTSSSAIESNHPITEKKKRRRRTAHPETDCQRARTFIIHFCSEASVRQSFVTDVVAALINGSLPAFLASSKVSSSKVSNKEEEERAAAQQIIVLTAPVSYYSS